MNLNQIELYEKISKNFLELSLDDVDIDNNKKISKDDIISCNEKIDYYNKEKCVSTEYYYQLIDGTKTEVKIVFYKNIIFIESKNEFDFDNTGKHKKRIISCYYKQTSDGTLTLTGERNDIVVSEDGTVKFNIKKKNTKKYNCYQGDFDFVSGTESLELINKDSIITENKLENNHPICFMNRFNKAVRHYLSIAREDEKNLKNDEMLDIYHKAIEFNKEKDTAIAHIEYRRKDDSNTITDCIISPSEIYLKNDIYYDYYIDEIIDYKERMIELDYKIDEIEEFDVTFNKHITDKVFYRNGQDKTTYEENIQKTYNHYLSDVDLGKDFNSFYYLDNSEKIDVIVPKEKEYIKK